MTRLDADRFLEDVTGRFARPYVRALDDILVAVATGNAPALRMARQQLGDIIRETLGMGEVLGATLSLQDAAKTGLEVGAVFRGEDVLGDRDRMIRFADEPTQSILPRVTFEDAVKNMVDRTPVTIRAAAERTAQNISKLYSKGSVVAFAKSAEAAVTKRAQQLIVDMIREGVPEVDAGRRIVTSVDEVRRRTAQWSQGYARMAFRTNLNTAVTAGRFRQMRDPALKRILPAFEFFSVGDVDTRHNHDAADEFVMLSDDPRWGRLAPPLGYNCRCKVRAVGVPELKRRGLMSANGDFAARAIPSGAGPDEGFRHAGRPDLLLSGVPR